VARAHRLLTSEQLQSSYVSLRLARLLIGLFLIAHWVGSIFWGISTLQDVSGTLAVMSCRARATSWLSLPG
jgi:hypothetical protein